MKKTLRTAGRSLFIFLIALGIYSCQQDELVYRNEIQESKNFVNLDEVKTYASILEFQSTSSSGRTTSSTKEIESVLEVPDEDGNPSFYIVNYIGSGYIIISADDRVEPIRAFSTEDHFSFNFEAYPNGLVEWLAGTSGLIHEARVLNIEQTEAVAQSWEICPMQQVMALRPIDDDGCGGSGGGSGGGCEDQYWEYGPLLTSVWGQWGGYNDLAPFIWVDVFPRIGNTCPPGENCCQAPTGCVATAMAQIMNYYEFPTGYNYADMPDTWGTLSTARLMRDAADAVNMDWGCDGSGADTEDEVASSFRNDFGYLSASYADFNQETVKQQIRWNRPVILRGGRKDNWFIFPVYKDGHAWVCDGYRRWTSCETGNGYLYLHMNWGWSSQALNGWFAYNNWSVNGNDFNYKKGMVYNIKPQ